jgi:hypothetical protein
MCEEAWEPLAVVVARLVEGMADAFRDASAATTERGAGLAAMRGAAIGEWGKAERPKPPGKFGLPREEQLTGKVRTRSQRTHGIAAGHLINAQAAPNGIAAGSS